MNNQYTEKSCQNAWQQNCLLNINQNQKWSSEDDQLLINLVKKYDPYADQWNIIASNFVS